MALTRLTQPFGAIMKMWQRQHGDIRGWGAKCDGVTDDTAAIQKALDNSFSVKLPSGVIIVRTLKLKSQIVRGTGMGMSVLKSLSNKPVFTGDSRIINAYLSDFTIRGNIDNVSNYGFYVNKGIRHSTFERIEFKDIGADAIHLYCNLSGGGAGAYYNTITDCVFGDSIEPNPKNWIKGSALFVKGTANRNSFVNNSVFGTGSHGLRFEHIDGNNYMCQNWTIENNGIEGCGKNNDSGYVAGIYLGNFVTNFSIKRNYFENNKNKLNNGAGIICNSSSIGIGSASISNNLFNDEKYCILVQSFSTLNITDNWRSGKKERGCVAFIRIDKINGSPNSGGIYISNTDTHSTCDVPFIETSLAGYPTAIGLGGEITSSKSMVNPDIYVDGLVKRKLNGESTFNRTGDAGDVISITQNNKYGDRVLGSIKTVGDSIALASYGAELRLDVGTSGVLNISKTFIRPTTNGSMSLGNTNYIFSNTFTEKITLGQQGSGLELTVSGGNLMFNGRQVALV